MERWDTEHSVEVAGKLDNDPLWNLTLGVCLRPAVHSGHDMGDMICFGNWVKCCLKAETE